MVDLRRSLAALLAIAMIAPLTACGDDKPTFTEPAAAGPSTTAGASAGAPAPESTTIAEPVSLTITPAKDKTGVPVSAEIGVKADGGEVTSVTLKDAKGKTVAGAMREDGSSWVPAKPLKAEQKYEATVVATGKDGGTTTATTSFTTMGAPGRRTGTGLYLFDGNTYGVAMPVVVEFNPGIKKADRAAVQYIFREYDAAHDRQRIAEQMAVIRVSVGKIVSIVGYYDSEEFHRTFWDE